MKVLVTGAGGFIGRYVVAALARRPEVELVLAGRNLAALADLPGQHVPLDISGAPDEMLYARLGRPERLVHLAWGELQDFRSSKHVGEVLPQHLRFLEALLAQGLPNLTVAGTCLEYGLQEGALAESLPTQPVVAYGIAKDALYKTLQAQQRTRRFALTWLRLFYMHGEGQSAKSILPLVDAALARGDAAFAMSPGDQLRDYLPVAQVAEYVAQAALQNRVTGAINIGSGVPIAVKELVRQHVAAAGGRIKLETGVYPYADYEPKNFWAKTERLSMLQDE